MPKDKTTPLTVEQTAVLLGASKVVPLRGSLAEVMGQATRLYLQPKEAAQDKEEVPDEEEIHEV